MKAQKSDIVCESPKKRPLSEGITLEECEFLHSLFQRAKPLRERSNSRIARKPSPLRLR